MENTCIHPDPLQVKEKHVRMTLTKKWYAEVSAGSKCYEFRLVGKYWTPRLKGATHVIFAQGSWIAAGPWFLFSLHFSSGTECSICIHANAVIAPVLSIHPIYQTVNLSNQIEEIVRDRFLLTTLLHNPGKCTSCGRFVDSGQGPCYVMLVYVRRVLPILI